MRKMIALLMIATMTILIASAIRADTVTQALLWEIPTNISERTLWWNWEQEEYNWGVPEQICINLTNTTDVCLGGDVANVDMFQHNLTNISHIFTKHINISSNITANSYCNATGTCQDLNDWGGSGGGTPGGDNTQIQYNDGGSFGGILNVTSDGSSVTFADDTALKFGSDIVIDYDSSGSRFDMHLGDKEQMRITAQDTSTNSVINVLELYGETTGGGGGDPGTGAALVFRHKRIGSSAPMMGRIYSVLSSDSTGTVPRADMLLQTTEDDNNFVNALRLGYDRSMTLGNGELVLQGTGGVSKTYARLDVKDDDDDNTIQLRGTFTGGANPGTVNALECWREGSMTSMNCAFSPDADEPDERLVVDGNLHMYENTSKILLSDNKNGEIWNDGESTYFNTTNTYHFFNSTGYASINIKDTVLHSFEDKSINPLSQFYGKNSSESKCGTWVEVKDRDRPVNITRIIFTLEYTQHNISNKEFFSTRDTRQKKIDELKEYGISYKNGTKEETEVIHPYKKLVKGTSQGCMMEWAFETFKDLKEEDYKSRVEYLETEIANLRQELDALKAVK